jgi:hypothetical protein
MRTQLTNQYATPLGVLRVSSRLTGMRAKFSF